MCLIVYSESKSKLDWEALEVGFRQNDDGWGIMYPRDERLVVSRHYNPVVDSSWKVFKKTMEKIPDDVKIGVHFRIRTHGAIADRNCHPFQILSKPAHGYDLYLMHNGTIPQMDPLNKEDDRSDTAIFAQDYLRQILKGNPGFMYTKAFQKVVKELAGGWSRLLFMNDKGEVWIYNESSGTKKDDVWYSNGGALVKKTITPTTTNYERGGWGLDRIYNQRTKEYVHRASKDNYAGTDDLFKNLGFERQADGVYLLKSVLPLRTPGPGKIINARTGEEVRDPGNDDSAKVRLGEMFMETWSKNLVSMTEVEVYHALIEYPTLSMEYLFNNGFYANKSWLDVFVDKFPEEASKWIYHRSHNQNDKLNQMNFLDIRKKVNDIYEAEVLTRKAVG